MVDHKTTGYGNPILYTPNNIKYEDLMHDVYAASLSGIAPKKNNNEIWMPILGYNTTVENRGGRTIIVREYNDAEILIHQETLVKDCLVGKVFEWYDDGSKKEIANYIDGRQHGLYSQWYANGILKHQGRWITDALEFNRNVGRHSWNYENGNPKVITLFTAAGRVKETTVYYENGQKQRETKYKRQKTVCNNHWKSDGTLIKV